MYQFNAKQKIIGIGALFAFIILFFLLGGPGMIAQSEKPEFCGGCHVMEAQYEAWLHTGAHRRKLCVDCHLPHDNTAVHFTWKTIDGLKDMIYFYTGIVSDQIRLSSHGASVVQKNCIRCHETTVMRINHDRKCWECHRRISHRRSGAMQTN